MAEENACSSCGAGISTAAFVCPFCGAGTGTFATTEAEELQMLRELSKAAQNIAGQPDEDDDESKHTMKIGAALARFWSVAPLPTQPGAIRQAATEACSGINGKRDGNYDITNGQVELMSRAKTCVAILKTMPEQAAVVVALEALIVDKDAILNPVWHKNPKVRFWLIVVGVLLLLCIPVIIMSNQGQSEDELREGLKSVSGVYYDGTKKLQISDSAISVKGILIESHTVKIVLEGNTKLTSWSSWDGSTFSFKTRVKSALSLDEDDQKDCTGNITKTDGGIEVTVSGNSEVCEGFDGTWSKAQPTTPDEKPLRKKRYEADEYRKAPASPPGI